LTAVASSDPLWEKRHGALANRLDSLVRDARDEERPGYNMAALWRAYRAHEALRDIETRAFELAREGARDAALALLSNAEYEDLQQAFSESAARFSTDYRNLLNERLLGERNKEVGALILGFAIFSVSLAVWIVLMRRLERRGKALAIEVSERQRAEFALRQREAILSQAQEIAHLGSFETDLSTGWEYWSDEFYRILGYAPGAFPAKQEAFLARIHPDERRRFQTAQENALSSSSGYDVELRIIRPSGEERSVWVRVKLERGPDGAVLRAVGTLYDTTERKQIEERLERSGRQLRNLAVHLQSVREEERTSVAREIHDEMGQSLTALKMDLFRMKKRLPSDDTRLAAQANDMVRSIDTLIEAVQRIMSELHPPVLDDLGLAAAVEWQLEQFHQRTGVRCLCETEVQGAGLSREGNLALFRILQEALTNVARHAKATRVTVRLALDSDWMTLEVHDNGRGISASDIESRHSFGLMGMRERVHVLGGELEIDGADGEGTRVGVRMPLLVAPGDEQRPGVAALE
jgi:PAS domain S-box-containing protein